jgi:hypothetical protein
MIDQDIAHALQMIAADGEGKRIRKVKAKHRKLAEEKFHTEMQLLSDEVEKHIPKSNPLFELVLILAAINKAERAVQQPEFTSDLEAGWPAGW